MEEPINSYDGRVLDAYHLCNKTASLLLAMHHLIVNGNDEEAHQRSLSFWEDACKFFNLGSSIPLISGDPAMELEVDRIVEKELHIEMGYTTEGWFLLKMPSLNPRKDKGNNNHLRRMLIPAFKKYFNGRSETQLFDKCWVIYRHVYDQNYDASARYDIDNYERNYVTDVIAMYVLVDDSAKHCNHILMSVPGSFPHTEVYVIPYEDLFIWLQAMPDIVDSELKIIESGGQI